MEENNEKEFGETKDNMNQPEYNAEVEDIIRKKEKRKHMQLIGIILLAVVVLGILVFELFSKPKPKPKINFLNSQFNANKVVKNAVPITGNNSPIVNNGNASSPIVNTSKKANNSNSIFIKPKSNNSNQQPIVAQGNINEMIKYNNLINTLKEKAKIAQLEQQIKSLHNTNDSNIAGGNLSKVGISLVAITKNKALISFGNKDVFMSSGMNYNGYECIMINSNSVVLEKNHRMINLSLSM